MEWLLGKTLSQLQEVSREMGLPAFTAKQMAQWLYQKRVRSLHAMTNLSKAARTALAAQYEVGGWDSATSQISSDGTRKYLFPKNSGIEAVVIPDEDRKTLCLSSQEGCAMNCQFCMTGRMGIRSQLSAGEIIGQFTGVEESAKLTNIVYMGMGEPLNNYEALLQSLQILTTPWGFAWSPRRITVSTVGILPKIRDFLAQTQVHLALSLHNPIPEERVGLMPVEKAYPLTKVLECLREHDWHGQRRISFEYTLLEGWNDTRRHARGLVNLLREGDGRLLRDGRVNLIRFHAIPDFPMVPSSQERILRFQQWLTEEGVTAPLRASKGEDILAACGLLNSRRAQSEVTDGTASTPKHQDREKCRKG